MTILINNKPYEAPKPVMTGEEIKELAAYPEDYWLILKDGTEDGTHIDDQQLVEIQSGMQFRIVNAAIFGVGASAAENTEVAHP